MSVLETFYILFKSDASNVKKGAEDAEKSTKKLDERLKNVGRESERVGSSFLSMARSASSALGAIVSVSAALSSVRGAVNEVREIGLASRDLEVNAESLDAWGHALQRTGGSAAQFQSTLRSLADHLNTMPDVALQSLPALADAFERMDKGRALDYGKSLGLDRATIRLLQQGRREVESIIRQQKELGLITEKDTERTKKFDDSLYKLGRVFQQLSREISIPALPALTQGLDYLVEHKDLITGALSAIGLAVAAMGLRFALANPAIAAVAAGLAAFSLAYEDYQKFKEGAPSVIGKAAGKFDRDVAGVDRLLQKIAPDFLSEKNLNPLINKYAHLPQFLGGQGFGGGDTTVNVSDVTIETQATNGKEIASSFSGWVDHLVQANSQFDSGVKI